MEKHQVTPMKLPALALGSLLALPAVHAQNKASAEWIPESGKVSPGQPFRTVVRLKVDEGWHTYWENPGEGGLPIKATADLPGGWTLGKIRFPAPIAFTTGALHGFGYKGQVLFPLTITPPAGSDATELPEGIVAEITWLTCNDSSCVPGKAEPTLADAQPELVEKAYAQLPEEIPGATLSFEISGDGVQLNLTLTSGSEVDPASCKVFPVTRNFIAPSSKPAFVKDGEKADTWTLSAPKSEYLEGTPETLSLVLVGKTGKAWAVSSTR